MKVKLRKPLPRSWMAHPYGKGIVVEGEVKPSHGSRLAAKVLVFRNHRSLDAFWRRALGREAGNCVAIVSDLHEHVISFKDGVEREWIEADPNYFCIMCFAIGGINSEIVTHESVHAAFSYVKRQPRSPYAKMAIHNKEEEICYPAGRIARGINLMFHDLGVYDDQRKREQRTRRGQRGADVRQCSTR